MFISGQQLFLSSMLGALALDAEQRMSLLA
jgi:hypothetical protein